MAISAGRCVARTAGVWHRWVMCARSRLRVFYPFPDDLVADFDDHQVLTLGRPVFLWGRRAVPHFWLRCSRVGSEEWIPWSRVDSWFVYSFAGCSVHWAIGMRLNDAAHRCPLVAIRGQWPRLCTIAAWAAALRRRRIHPTLGVLLPRRSLPSTRRRVLVHRLT